MATRTRQKTLALQANKDKRPVAHARYIRISPYKVRTVLDLVRGIPVNQAFAVLRNMPRGASEAVYKLVASAVANAENNLNLDADTLYIAEITASQGPHIKRMVPKAKGSSGRILKRTSHLTIKLDGIDSKIVNTTSEAIATKAIKSTKTSPKGVSNKGVSKVATNAPKDKKIDKPSNVKPKTKDVPKATKDNKSDKTSNDSAKNVANSKTQKETK